MINTEEYHTVDKINISAVVTDYSDNNDTVNVSTVFYEGSDEITVDNAIKKLLSNPQEFILDNYVATFLVENLDTGREYRVEEVHSKKDEMSRISVRDPLRNASSICSYDSSGSGLCITGVRCKYSTNLPGECFCWDGVCSHPFIPFNILANKLVTMGEDLVENNPGIFLWRLDSEEIVINITFSLPADRYLFPVVIFVEGEGYNKEDITRLKYSTISFRPVDNPEYSPLQSLPGIFCPVSPLQGGVSRTLPDIPRQFSLMAETVDKDSKIVSFSQLHYDLKHKLVSRKFFPHPDSTISMFFTILPLASHFLPESHNIIHDFSTGLQYMVNEKTGQCTIKRITGDYGDAIAGNGSFRMKVGRELFSVNPEKYVYTGKRNIRGILADVWIAENSRKDPDEAYSTTEIYFSDSDYIFREEGTMDLKAVPIGMSTYGADSRTSS